ncbi:permease [Duganella sp. FT92W]|uniref:Permease n=1 Tax=Pseudoduganella rivuli TaxID=2666085 RepID=A0A7X2LSE1_9BURK|nr:permease [Pseudoduganella rivuli]MRV71808.1 permease [Pseudoduganella rivuli]
MQRSLTFSHNPPLSLPLRFLLCAPVFALLAGALLLWAGPAAFASRWTSAMLAATHLLTLGCLCMAMLGSLLQILPSVAGVPIGRHRAGAAAHAALCAGAVTLAAAFLLERPLLFAAALVLLAPALFGLVGLCAAALWQRHAEGATSMVAATRTALAALAVTTVLGALLASQFAWPGTLPLPLLHVTDVHAAWGLLGWTGLLIVGVAYQVVPMFQVTALYPGWMTRSLTPWLFILLVVLSVASGLPGRAARAFTHSGTLAAAAGFTAFGLATCMLLVRRKRPKAEATTLFWYAAIASLLAACVLGVLPAAPSATGTPLLLGVLLVAGFAFSAINGMLYKIVPFLVWYHLQNTVEGGCRSVPSVTSMIPAPWVQRQFHTHAAALVLLLGACVRPEMLARPAAAMFCLSACLLCINLAHALRVHARLRRRDDAVAILRSA